MIEYFTIVGYVVAQKWKFTLYMIATDISVFTSVPSMIMWHTLIYSVMYICIYAYICVYECQWCQSTHYNSVIKVALYTYDLWTIIHCREVIWTIKRKFWEILSYIYRITLWQCEFFFYSLMEISLYILIIKFYLSFYVLYNNNEC